MWLWATPPRPPYSWVRRAGRSAPRSEGAVGEAPSRSGATPARDEVHPGLSVVWRDGSPALLGVTGCARSILRGGVPPCCGVAIVAISAVSPRYVGTRHGHSRRSRVASGHR